MRNSIYIIVTIVLLTISNRIEAQVTIGSSISPSANALLDLKENAQGTSTKGLILPRVALESVNDFFGSNNHEEGTIVYNMNTSDTSVAPANRVSKGLYYNNGSQWEKLDMSYLSWFYMPSIAIPTEQLSTTDETLDLYEEYKKQFSGADNSTFKSSQGAPAMLPFLPKATDLYYYVTYYSPDVFEISNISEEGIMTYKVINYPSDKSYINVVFLLK